MLYKINIITKPKNKMNKMSILMTTKSIKFTTLRWRAFKNDQFISLNYTHDKAQKRMQASDSPSQ